MPSDWNIDIAGQPGLTPDAPTSGAIYGRQNATWVPITTAAMGGFLNKFRNPTMDVAQRGTPVTATAGASPPPYTLDGWQVAATGVAASVSQQYNSNLSGNALRIACASALTGCTLIQRIESTIAAQLLNANKTAQVITIQFTIFNFSGVTVTPSLTVAYPTARDNFASTTTDTSPMLQAIFNNTIGIVAFSYTPSTSIQLGLQVSLGFAAQLAQASGYVDISYADIRATPGVALGLNNNPPPVEMRPIQQELAFCQRYYYDPANGGSTTVFQLASYASAAVAITTQTIILPVTMRVNPTVAVRNQGYVGSSAIAVAAMSPDTLATTVTATAVGNVVGNLNFSASAEL